VQVFNVEQARIGVDLCAGRETIDREAGQATTDTYTLERAARHFQAVRRIVVAFEPDQRRVRKDRPVDRLVHDRLGLTPVALRERVRVARARDPHGR
jgi:hypothetical protein